MRPLTVVAAFVVGALVWYGLAQGMIRLLRHAFGLDGMAAVLIVGAVLLPLTWLGFRYWERRRK